MPTIAHEPSWQTSPRRQTEHASPALPQASELVDVTHFCEESQHPVAQVD